MSTSPFSNTVFDTGYPEYFPFLKASNGFKVKADFGGIHISPDDSYNNAKQFIVELKERLAKHLDAGNSLEPTTTTS